MHITEGGLDDARVIALLETHLARARAETGPMSAHALDLVALDSPDVRFFSVWADETLLGIGAWKRLDAGHGEVKSMHTAEAVRGRGVGGALLRHIIDDAKAHGIARLSLETGSWDYFRLAVALYKRHGFTDCAPFADYAPDPNSVFLTRDLRGR
jgi:putative acetyltransferase